MRPDSLYSFQVARPLLKAMSLFQSKDASRSILNATLFEIRSNGMLNEVTLVSTDGRRIAIHRHEILSDNLLTNLPAAADFSVDLAGVNKLPKSRGVAGNMLTVSVFEKHAEITCGKYKYKADFISEGEDGKNGLPRFPKWRTTIPAAPVVPSDAFNFNVNLMAAFSKAAELLNVKSEGVSISQHGKDSALSVRLLGCREFYGVLMPIKTDVEQGQQDWVKQSSGIVTPAFPSEVAP